MRAIVRLPMERGKCTLPGKSRSSDDVEDVYSKDGNGRFSRKAKRLGKHAPYDWKMPELNGMVLTGPGSQAWNFLLDRDEGRDVRTLKLAFKRSPTPVRR
jgi:hypothetical protein